MSKAPGRCTDCTWIHEADSAQGTSFRGVQLCPLHNAAQTLLAALKLNWKHTDDRGQIFYCNCPAYAELSINCSDDQDMRHATGCTDGRQAIRHAESRAFQKQEQLHTTVCCAGLNPAAFRQVVEAARSIVKCVDEDGKFVGTVPTAAQFRALVQAIALATQGVEG